MQMKLLRQASVHPFLGEPFSCSLTETTDYVVGLTQLRQPYFFCPYLSGIFNKDSSYLLLISYLRAKKVPSHDREQGKQHPFANGKLLGVLLTRGRRLCVDPRLSRTWIWEQPTSLCKKGTWCLWTDSLVEPKIDILTPKVNGRIY